MEPIDDQIIVTCEHASNELPQGLDLDPELLQLHIAWDPGARRIARRLADRFDAPLFEGEVSRLVIDLNRSVDNRMLIRRVSDGHRIPFNYGLGEQERRRRIERWHRPYRERIVAAAEETIERAGRCIHLCIHTFTGSLSGTSRANDIGLLHDPAWGLERELCTEVRRSMEERSDLVVWFNRPYSGTADGILPAMRERFRPETFVGLELEVNQKHAGQPAALDEIADLLVGALNGARCLRH